MSQVTDPDLTFQPKVNDRKPKNASQGPKWEQLHAMAEKFQRLKFDREIDAIEWTKDPEQYTFKPVILGDKKGGKGDTKRTQAQVRPETAPVERKAVPSSKNPLVDKKLEGAKKKEVDMQKRKTTVAKNENLIEEDLASQAVDQEDDDEDDQVFIDIALGNKKHRITLTKSSDPELLAANFALEHNLDSKMQKKLCEQLANNMKANF